VNFLIATRTRKPS